MRLWFKARSCCRQRKLNHTMTPRISWALAEPAGSTLPASQRHPMVEYRAWRRAKSPAHGFLPPWRHPRSEPKFAKTAWAREWSGVGSGVGGTNVNVITITPFARVTPEALQKHTVHALFDSPVCQRAQVARRCRRRRAASARARPRPPGDRPRASREPGRRSASLGGSAPRGL